MKKSNAKKKPKARKKPGPKLKGGRPTKWKPEFMEQAEKLILGGFTMVKVAKFFGIDRSRLYVWMDENPKFKDTLGKAKDDYDTGRVEKSLLRRAIGFRYKEKTRENKFFPSEDETQIGGEWKMVLTKEVTKMVVPDTPAMALWLTNRNSKRWPGQRQLHDITPEAANFIMNIGKKGGK